MALGVVGLTLDDFCRLTFPEFEAVMKAYRERDEQRQQSEWERMRLHAVMTMQPHCRKKLDPKRVLPFEWEKRRKNSTPALNKDQAKEAFLRRISGKE